ncbi:MAG TPA: hypothetical protein VGJ12_06855 [Gemmatimonadaceae bacterium]
MFRQESGRLGVDQNEGPDAGSSQGDSNFDGEARGQGGFVDAAKEKIQQLASQARETASGQVESRFSSGKTQATQALGSVAQTLKSSSQQLRDQQQAGIGKYAEQAANKIEEISHYLENASLNDVATRVENFARREPAFFIGSAVALGFLSARFLKSSQRDQQGRTNMRQGFQGSMQSSGEELRGQGAGDGWQGSGDRDVTSAPRREWTTVGNERQSNPNDIATDRMGRA